MTRRGEYRDFEGKWSEMATDKVRDALDCMVPKERCEKCGFLFEFANARLQFIYMQCPLCLYAIPPRNALNIPPPHSSIPDDQPYPLCRARVNSLGLARRCERRKVGSTDYCTKHNQSIRRFGNLPYGNFGEEYKEEHEIILEKELTNDEEMQEPLTYDERIKVAAEAEKIQSGLGAHDTLLLRRTRETWIKREKRGLIKKEPISTEQLTKIVEPTFGVDFKVLGKEKRNWLRESFEAISSLPKARFVVIAASLGHKIDPLKAINVTPCIEGNLKENGGNLIFLSDSDVLSVQLSRTTRNISKICFDDPCPGEKKYLRIRYCIDATLAQVTIPVIEKPVKTVKEENQLNVNSNQKSELFLEKQLRLELPKGTKSGTSRLTILKAVYGHPHDNERRFNVTEHVQGLVDVIGGAKFLQIDAGLNLSEIFGEPCTGVIKNLEITYHVEAIETEIAVPETNDFLLHPICIKAPIVAPNLIVTFATLSPKSLVGRHFGAKAGGKAQLLNYNYFASQSGHGKKTSIRTLDDQTIVVTDEVRYIVNEEGGDWLNIQAGDDVFNVLSRLRLSHVYRQRFKGKELVLEIEIRANGKVYNFKSETDSEHLLQDSIQFCSRPAQPSIQIHAAFYGHPTDQSMQSNVTEIVDTLTRNRAGRELVIDDNQSLKQLFGDPCYPFKTNKILHVRYGVIQIQDVLVSKLTESGLLQQTIKIGWPW